MEDTKILTVTGRAFHLPGDDIDTDRIIPARYLRCVTFDGLGEHVFEDDRQQLAGKHPFDLLENKERSILIADVNFGCGSSREHAVAAIQRWGIKAIIARSFAQIFRGNATANGLVCVDVNEPAHADLLAYLQDFPTRSLSIDLVEMYLDVGMVISRPCIMPSADRDMLTTGTWDTTATLLKAGDLIEATAAKLPYMQATQPVG